MTGIAKTALKDDSASAAADWLIFSLGALSGLVLLFSSSDDLGPKIAGMLVLVTGAAAAVRFDIAHPFVWFSGAFTLYSISGPLLLHLGIHPYVTWGGYWVKELDFAGAMDLQFLVLLGILTIFGPRRMSFAESRNSIDLQPCFSGALIVLLTASVIGVLNIVEISGQGLPDKRDVVLYGGWTTRLSFAFNVAATAFGVYLAKLFTERRNKTAALTLVLMIAFGLGVVLLIGQRHFLIRSCVIGVLVFHLFHRRVSVGSLLLFATAILIASTLLGGLKMTLLLGTADDVDFGALSHTALTLIAQLDPNFATDPPLVQYVKVGLFAALGSEAMTPGNNLAMLLSRVPQDMPFLEGSTFLVDLMRSITPGFIYAPALESTGGVYNSAIFPSTDELGGGVGFTIVGYGFLHFGYGGVVLVAILVGLLVRTLYRAAARSAFGLLFYIGFFPVAAYIARNDITGPISQGIKHVLLPLILMQIVSLLLRRATPFASGAPSGGNP